MHRMRPATMQAMAAGPDGRAGAAVQALRDGRVQGAAVLVP
jgi:hypothetical protein